MKVLVLTQLFPNKEQPLLGIFVKERMKGVAEFCGLKIVAPVPWFLPLKTFKRWYRFSQIPYHEVIDGLDVFHPRFFLVPKVGRCFYGILYFLSVFPHILRLRKGFDFDILDVHWAYPDGFAGVLLGKLLKKPVAITVRGADVVNYPKYLLLRKLISHSLSRADIIIAVSNALKEEVLKLGISKEKVKVILNGVDVKKFYPMEKIEARSQLKLSMEKTIIISVGSLLKRKGFHNLIKAISDLEKREFDNIILFIIGEGPYKSKLQEQIDWLNAGSFVRLIGFKNHEELPKWYNAADFFCLASEREGCPNVIIESLACGVPIVATKVEGVPEIICSKDYGILVENQKGLAEAIKRALNKDWDYKKLIQYAKENTWAKCANKVFQEFKKVLNHTHSFGK